MGTVSRVHTFASGAILTAAQLNNEFDNLLTSSAINGGLDATNLGVTAGQATASKALVVDASRNLADGTGSNRINNLALSGTFESTGAITATAGITSGGNIVSDTDSTDDLGTTGVRWANLFVDDVTVTNNVTIGGTLTLTGGITLNGNTTIGDSSADTLTVNSTITSNLIFTDATYDIGASGATRPRDLFLSRNAVMGGTLGVTGLITATGGVSGSVTSSNATITGGTITGITDIAVADGGTGASTAAAARTNLGVAIGSDVQAYDAGLADIAALATTDGNIIVGSGSNWVAESGATARTSLGLGSIATQNANAVSITGGSLTGMTSYSGGTISGTTGTFSGDVAVNTSTLKVDTGNNRVGINKSSPDSVLHLYNSGALAELKIEANGVANPRLTLHNNLTYHSQITYTNDLQIYSNGGSTRRLDLYSNGDLAVDTDTLFVDASADRVGVNTSSADASLHIIGSAGDPSAAHSSGNAQLILENNGQTYLEFATGTTHYSGITFSDDVATRGAVVYDHGTALGGGADSLHFQTAGSIKAVITSAGNVGIGTDSPSALAHVYNGTLQVGSKTGDGGIQQNTDAIRIAALPNSSTEWGGLQWYREFSDYIGAEIIAARPSTNESETDLIFKTSGTAANATERARILSSGGITFNGDTAAANALDDYEEGTWTPTFTPSTSGSITLAAGGGAYYTKIGQLVTATLSVTVASVSSPIGYVSVNLPFAPNTSNQKGRSGVAIYVDGLFAGHNTRDAIALTEDSSASLRIYQGDSNSNQADFAQAVGAGTYFNLTVSYIV